MESEWNLNTHVECVATDGFCSVILFLISFFIFKPGFLEASSV